MNKGHIGSRCAAREGGFCGALQSDDGSLTRRSTVVGGGGPGGARCAAGPGADAHPGVGRHRRNDAAAPHRSQRRLGPPPPLCPRLHRPTRLCHRADHSRGFTLPGRFCSIRRAPLPPVSHGSKTLSSAVASVCTHMTAWPRCNEAAAAGSACCRRCWCATTPLY